MPRPLTQSEVIAQFRSVHGRRYDYSRVEYVNSSTKVLVGCNVHGFFEIAPGHHKNGTGCARCYFDAARVGLKEFTKRACEVHGTRYDYSKVAADFTSDQKVTIRCKVHKTDFDQVASAHLAGHTGCPECKSNKLSGPSDQRGHYKSQASATAAFIARANEVHKSAYDYSQSVYVAAEKKLAIVCPTHGVFHQTPSNHLKGTKCPKCAIEGKYKDSLKTLCKALSVDYHRAIKRRQAGMSTERVLELELLRSERAVNPITVHGIQYPNLESAVRALDPPASSATISRWISKGMSPEKAFEEIPNPGYANGSLYLVRHLDSGKCYVGLTICTLEERWSRHIAQAYLAKIKAHHSLHAAIRKFGPDAFTVEQIGSGTTKAGLEAAERRKIAELKTLAPHGYNISPGGGSGGAAGVPIKVDGMTFASKRAAAEHLVATRKISPHAAKARLRFGRLDPKPVAKSGESLVKTRAYKTWSHIVHCATNPNNRDYLPGISVSPRWKADFKHFLDDMGQPEPGQVFSRKDKSMGFTKANCEWRTVTRFGHK